MKRQESVFDRTSLISKVRKFEVDLNGILDLKKEILEDFEIINDLNNENISSVLAEVGLTKIDTNFLKTFTKKPYVIIPRKEGEWFLCVPKFIPYQLGWLYQQTESFNIFIVNRYVDWLYPLPAELKREIGMDSPKIPAVLKNGKLYVEAKDTDAAFKRYRPFVNRREKDGVIVVNSKKEFELTAALIRDGILPFERISVKKEDLRDSISSIILRDYQEPAWKTFTESGAIGVYWSPGAGKMYFGIHCIGSLKGRKIVVVPTRILVEAWTEKIQKYAPEALDETIITTYQSAKKYLNEEFILVIFDEHQHLPASTYGRLSSIKSKYRLGLSATPFREDGKVELIFALTGFPVGLDWSKLFSDGIIQKPVANVLITKNLTQKLSTLKDILAFTHPKRLIFCDSIDLGKQISKELEVPFIHGETKDRLIQIYSNDTVVVSRVADEGIDITDLQAVIEIDFLFGSRRQELQRMGRLLHSRFKGEHFIIMTQDEYQAHKKRLLSLYEKGFEVKVKEV